jgi:type I restriction enzyme S subunit
MSELPPGWVIEPLANAARIVMGQSPPGASYNSEGTGVPFFQGKAEFTSLTAIVRKWTTAGTKFAEKGDILLSVRAPVGPTNIAPERSAIGRGLAAIRAKEGVDQRYLLWALRASAHDLAAQGTGSTFSAINAKQLREHPISVAPLEMQRRIVDILEDHISRLDAGNQLIRQSLKRIAALQQQIIESTLTGADLISAPGTERLPDTGVDDGALAQLPDGWRWRRLGELADVVGGVTKDSKKQTDPSYVEVPYLRVANVQRGRLDLTTVTTIRVPPQKAQDLVLRRGDVLLNEGGDRDKLGRGWVWNDEITDCIHQNHVFRARIRDGDMDPRLLSWAANTFGGPWCERNGKQSVNLASISLSRIRLMPVPVPPREVPDADVARIEDTLALRCSVRPGCAVHC